MLPEPRLVEDLVGNPIIQPPKKVHQMNYRMLVLADSYMHKSLPCY